MTSHSTARRKTLHAPRLAATIASVALLASGALAAHGPFAARFPVSPVATPPDTSFWALLSPNGSPPFSRTGQSAIYDPARRRMIIFGGFGGAYLNDTWALSLTGVPSWTPLMPSGAWPSARVGHSAIYDPLRDRMIIFGGNSYSLHPYMSDVWALSLSDPPAWTQLQPAGGPISPRGNHSAIYDPVRDRMIVFGGLGGVSPDGEVWALSLTDPMAWTLLSPSSNAPDLLFKHRAVYDPVRDAMIVFGGLDDAHIPHNEVWMLSLAVFPTWSTLAPGGQAPPARAGHVMVYDPRRDRILIHGGMSADSFLSDVWELDVGDPPRWISRVFTGASPPTRQGHAGIFFADSARMVFYGGNVAGGVGSGDVWAADWCRICTPGGVELIPPRTLHLEPAGANPFRNGTAFRMGVARGGRATLRVYDLAGRLVATLVDRDEQPGWRDVSWDGRNERGAAVPSGVYLARLESGGQERVRKVVVSR